MINSQDEKSATFRPNERVIGGYKVEQLKGHDILCDMRRNQECLATNGRLAQWPNGMSFMDIFNLTG